MVHFQPAIWPLLISGSLVACDSPNVTEKLGFDLSILDQEGLYGEPGGERALHYEFCIPRGRRAGHEVTSIDPSVTFSESPGRVGCSPDQLLAQGSTHQPNHREILLNLAKLRYIERVEQSFFE